MTALGLNNYGAQVYRYGLEDIDRDEKGEEVFREMDSTFFCRVRDLFPSELKALYNTLESKNAWHAESFINKADQWQSQFPEELWRLDIERKYIRTYNSSFINGEGDSQFLVNMSNGKMKYHRRQWERSQEKYMASKYQSSTASSDNSVFRCSVPNGELAVQPNYRLKLTPYAYMYLNVKYGTQNPIQLRAEPNKVYEIPFDGEKADIVDVYSSSLIQDFGDLSACYVATADTSKASKVKRLIFGNATEGYDNPSFTTLTTGANYLLEELNIENVSGLEQSLNLSTLNNLRLLYAHGSNISGVTFADGGRIEIAQLPAISAMSMKNLIYLTTLDVTSFDKLTNLTVENCSTVDLITVFDAAENISRVRITGVDWKLDDTSLLKRIYGLYGIDKDGYNIEQSVLAGTVHVPVIRQQELYEFNTAWPDLEVKYDSIIEQFAATFINDDGTVLDVQYIDKGQTATDPLTRSENPIATPTKESSVSTDFTFSGWDGEFIAMFEDLTFKALYSESLRTYTITYMSKGVEKQVSTGLYGETVPYVGDTPVYTAEEPAYKYNLFSRWDKTGLIDGDKVVNAIFDTCEYRAGYFDGKTLAGLRPVEIYAMTKLGLEETVILPADEADENSNKLTIQFGQDYDFDEISDKTFEYITEKQTFNGKTYIDTKEMLLSEDRDFVLAIDYKFADSAAQSILAGCVDSFDGNGFKLIYNNGVQISWGSKSHKITENNVRDLLVIRHKKGNNNLMVYSANMNGDEPVYVELEKATETVIENPLVFGCQKNNDGSYENYATGEINWCKLWYTDLGDEACKAMAMWTHEKVEFEACGFKHYYLAGSTSKRCSFSMLATHLLENSAIVHDEANNEGGWAEFTLNARLNSRLAKAIPTEWKTLIKQVQIPSSVGNKSTEISYSDCYIAIPALIEVDPTKATEPYINEGKGISYMTGNASRVRNYPNGEAGIYWLRSPNIDYTSYVWAVQANGNAYGYYTPGGSNPYGVLIEISI